MFVYKMGFSALMLTDIQPVLPTISDLCIHVCIKQAVLRFQVPVDHHVPVTIIHTRKDLLEQTATFLFVQLGKIENILSCALD